MTYRDFLDVPEWLHGQDEDTSSPRSSYSVESDSGGSAESATSSCPSELEDIRPSTAAWKWLTISTIRHAQVRTVVLISFAHKSLTFVTVRTTERRERRPYHFPHRRHERHRPSHRPRSPPSHRSGQTMDERPYFVYLYVSVHTSGGQRAHAPPTPSHLHRSISVLPSPRAWLAVHRVEEEETTERAHSPSTHRTEIRNARAFVLGLW